MTLSHVSVIGLAEQAAIATPTDPVTHLVPVTAFSASENFEQILDNGRRGPDAMDFRAVQGIAFEDITIEGNVQANGATGMGFAMLLRNLLGSGIGATSYVAPIQIGGTGVYKHYRFLGNTKEYLTIEHDFGLGGSTVRQIGGCRCHELIIRWNAGEGALTYTATLTGRSVALTTITSLTGQVTTQEDPFAGWRGVIVANALSNTRLISAEWTLSRGTPVRQYSAQNVQTYADLYFEPLTVTCSLVFNFIDNTEIALFRNKTQGSLTNLFEYGAGGTLRGFGIGGLLFDFGDGPAELDNTGANITLGLVARGLYSAGNGPIGTVKVDSNAQNGPIETLTEEAVAARY
jgi:hypothetical protein